MSIQTFAARQFTRDVAAAKRAAMQGPVFITERGQPAFALLSIEEFHRLTGKQERTLLEVMQSIPGGGDFDFEPPRMDIEFRVPDFERE